MKKHWIEQLAEETIKKKKEPFVITAGFTTSGPAHLGTLCEFLYPAKIEEVLRKKGYKTKFIFIADIMDAFDSIPENMKKYEEELKKELGKPLCFVPDPTGKAKSFGEHFLNEVLEAMNVFEIKAKIVKANEIYESGKADKYAKLFIKEKEKVLEVLERVSGKKEKKGWHPLMPICESCGKIATTSVIRADENEYEYECNKDVGYTKGCGYRGKNKLSEHKYKLVWRLHWVMWQDLFNSAIEGGGVDHFTKGGSRDSLVAIFKEILKKEPSIGFKFGFVMVEGKKYSKSKGRGMSLKELIEIIPPQVLSFILIRPDVQENKDINPTKEKLIRAIEEYEMAEKLLEKEKLSRAEEKRLLAFKLSGTKRWKVPFRDILLYYNIYGNWNTVKEMVNDEEGVEYLRSFIEKWEREDLIPEEMQFKYNPTKAEGIIREFFEELDEKDDALTIHNKVFEFAKRKGVEPKELFKNIYKTLIGKEKGPRLGKLIYALGVERVKKEIM